MPIHVQCPNPACGKSLQCPDEHAGKTVKCPACGTSIQTPAPRAQGPALKLTNYQLLRKLGEGGMGAVYEAIHVKLKRHVALKILPQQATKDPVYLERFYREAQAAAALNHPNIVQVHDFAEDKGFHFLAMEFVDGESAQARLKREGRVPLDVTLDVVESVAKGLQYAHGRGIIHRDVKPDNILIGRDGQVKLGDLGLAKRIDEDKGLTREGAGMGTPYYMAPEQAEDARHVDHRADIYALGITFLHLLTGKRPFDGDSSYNVIIQHREKELPSARELGAELPPGVEAVIRKMAAKNRDGRYQDYASLLSDLAKLRSGQIPHALEERLRDLPTAPAMSGRKPTAPQVAAVSPGKGRLWVGIGVAAVLVLGLGVFLVVRGGKPPAVPAPSPAIPAPSAPTTQPPAVTQTVPPETLPAQPDLIAAMLASAKDYAAAHPDEFGEIVKRFNEVKRRGIGTIHEIAATSQVDEWTRKWETAADLEYGKSRQSAEQHLAAGKLGEAQKVWGAFPEGLKTKSVGRKIDEEAARIKESVKRLVQKLGEDAEPLLAKTPGELGEDELTALAAMKMQAEGASDCVPDEMRDALAALVDRIEAAIEDDRKAGGTKRVQAFWTQYEGLMKDRKFDRAEALAAESKGVLDERSRKQLAEDTLAIGGIFAAVAANLPRLKGTSLRVGGIGMTVTDIRDGKIVLKQGSVEKTLDPEQLECETRLNLAFSTKDSPDVTSVQKAMFMLYSGDVAAAIKALDAAAKSGADVSLYQARLAPVLVVGTVPPGATVELFKKGDAGQWVRVDIDPSTTPLRKELARKTAYKIEVSKDMYCSETHEMTTGDGGEHGFNLRLKKGGLPASMKDAFEVPGEPKDQYGNPTRRGLDKATAFPLEIRHKESGIHLVFIPAGEFLMGSPGDETGRGNDEGPQHRVRIAQSFYLAKHELTQGQWTRVMGNRPWQFTQDSEPVHEASKSLCEGLINKLNGLGGTGKNSYVFSFPTEAQWEYACRAGTRTRYSYGADPDDGQFGDYGWHIGNSGRKLNPVGQKKPNAWGLYDMHGSIWEWCQDKGHANYEGAPSDGSAWLTGSGAYLMIRGGSYANRPSDCRSAKRCPAPPDTYHFCGLRVALTLPQASAGSRSPNP